MSETIKTNACYHCGADCGHTNIAIDDKRFCCAGCKTVFEILQSNDMHAYYELNDKPGITKQNKKQKDFAYLDNEDIQQQLFDFSDDGVSVIQLFLPAIHCSSCIWLLENIDQLKEGIIHVQVNFPKRTARVTFKNELISLREVVELLSAIGYEPVISLETIGHKSETKDRTLLYKFGIAAFAFGNVMLMAIPEYIDYNDSTLQIFLPFFRWLMLALSIPVLVYSANDYFKSAFKGLKHNFINIDVPIALGLIVLFTRSAYDVVTNSGPGYFDSLTGLVFFLLLGKFFQRRTYESLSFERDYKSYFPVAVTKLGADETSIPVNNLKNGDRILIRNEELIPADCILLKGEALIDNSFVTGEATPVKKQSGDKIFAGGKQVGEAIELEVIKPVEQSYLTQLWNHDVFTKEGQADFKSLTDRISKYFTLVILLIATGAAAFWYVYEPAKAVTVFTSILIVACPCALALSAPFTHGNVLRILGRNKFFVKDASTIERMAEVTTLVWDKTGTLTTSDGTHLTYEGDGLSQMDEAVFRSMARQSNHPLSRMLYNHLHQVVVPISGFAEEFGKGSETEFSDHAYRLGSADWCYTEASTKKLNETRIYLAKDGRPIGYFKVKNEYRHGVFDLIKRLAKKFKQALLSGDSSGEIDVLQPVFGADVKMNFNQKPEDKLNLINTMQNEGDLVLMIGDGLNDAGALQQSNVGVSLSEDVNTFSPACDAILDASELNRLDTFLDYAKSAKRVIIASFILSFTYNIVGLSFAASGMLSPVVSAILMPLSSITIVVFVTLLSNWIAKNKGL